jgi:hypothetical protein
MMDRFDIQRDWDTEGERIAEDARIGLEEERERERARVARLIKLSPGYYFDPLEKALLKKAGGQFGFIRHDRRHEREVKANQAQAEARGFRLVAGGLYWDLKAKKLYRKSGANYLLYTSDRRKAPPKSRPDKERRSAPG